MEVANWVNEASDSSVQIQHIFGKILMSIDSDSFTSLAEAMMPVVVAAAMVAGHE